MVAVTVGKTPVTPAPLRAANPSQISYLQVLNGAGRPRTAFTAGQSVGFKVVVYAPGYRRGSLSVRWRVVVNRRTVMTGRPHGFSGPTRGNLFSETSRMRLPVRARKGTYVAQAMVRVGGMRRSRTVRFYVR